MFDIGWSELLVVGVVALLLVGPKELPGLLRMMGRYLGVVRRHANEFRSVFDQAMREAEMDTLRDEMRSIGDGVKTSLDEATRSVDDAKAAMRVDLNSNRAVQPPAGAAAAPSASVGEASEPQAPTGTNAPDAAAQPSKDAG